MSDLKTELPGFTGTILRPEDEGYDEARAVFNGLIDRRPALMARCTSAADVAAAVRFGRHEGLTISVYGGGHSVTGAAVQDGGLCIDLRGLKDISVDPVGRVMRGGGGLTWGELDAATQAHGLAVTGGRVPTTGIGGLSLGSGSGWLERAFGFTCDNLLEAEVVTAKGDVVTASATENPDLFWAIRGGGGNFGIVTRFTLRLHPLGPIVWGGMLVYPGFRGAEVLKAYREFVATAPDAVGSGLAFMTAPHADFVPEPARGHPAVGIICCYAGDPADAPAAYAPLLALEPAMAMVQPMPYVDVQQLIAPGNPPGMRNYWTADFYDELPDEAVDLLATRATAPVSPLSQVIVIPGGGAASRVPDDAMAFGSRDAKWNIHYLSMWESTGDDERNIEHTRTMSAELKPWATGTAYLNFLGDEGPRRVEASFGPEKWARLQQTKAVWDPDNLFHVNQNIPPAPSVPPQR